MKISAWFHLLAAALLVTPAFASPVRTQTLATADVVPEGLTAPEWSSIRQQYEQQRHAAFPVAGGYQARNPGQQWQTRFDGRGFTVTSEPGKAAERGVHAASTSESEGTVKRSEARAPRLDSPAWQWGLELQSYGFAGQERAVQDQPRVNTSGPRVTYDWDATVQEWFVNDRRGLEHGFTVRERPNQPGSDDREVLECASPLALWNLGEELGSALGLAVGIGRADEKRQRAGALQDAVALPLNSQPSTLNFLLAVRGGLRPEVQADGRGVRFVDAQGAAALTYSELTVLDADGRKLPARFESAPSSSGRESAHAISLEGQSRLRSAATASLERGVHAASTPASEGTVKRSEDRAPQTETGLLRLAIDERGARYPLTIDPIAQQAYLKASNTDPDVNAYDGFGLSVAVSGNTVVIGAPFESSSATGVNGNQSNNSAPQAGAAYVFVRNGTTWAQQAYLKASNTDAGDWFGGSVAVTGDTVVVGAWGEDSSATGVDGDQSDNSALGSGAAYVFVRSGTNWTQQAYLKASNTDGALPGGHAYDGDVFGGSVAVSGDTVVVGADGESSNATGVNGDGSDNSAVNSGAAYVFVRSGTTWTQQAYLKASNTGVAAYFGYSVSVSGDTVVVGARNQFYGGSSSGAAYVFVRNETTWTQQAYLKASNTGADDYFGWSVAVSGDTVVVGAIAESSNATGVNGNQSNNSALGSGAAYVFVRTGTTWTQQAYLKASNTGVSDMFGFSVSVSGDTVVVGVYAEDSSATGVNGNQTNNSAGESGAAYVFVRNGTTWTQQAYLKASNTDAGDYFGYSVAVSGDTVVVGASGEESSATGVNGNQSDNSANRAGATYVFTGVGLGTRLAVVRDGSGGYFLRFTGAPDVTYGLQRAPSVIGPWSALVTNTAPASGLIEYHETSPPPVAAFYRTTQP